MKEAYGDTPAPYPESPGFKEPTTSRDAARSMESTAATLRVEVLAAIAAAGEHGSTADEAAKAIGQTVLAVRPRVTELLAEGLIVDTGRTRKNESRRNAKVWRAS